MWDGNVIMVGTFGPAGIGCSRLLHHMVARVLPELRPVRRGILYRKSTIDSLKLSVSCVSQAAEIDGPEFATYTPLDALSWVDIMGGGLPSRTSSPQNESHKPFTSRRMLPARNESARALRTCAVAASQGRRRDGRSHEMSREGASRGL